jgi:uncharacterized protein YoxC
MNGEIDQLKREIDEIRKSVSTLVEQVRSAAGEMEALDIRQARDAGEAVKIITARVRAAGTHLKNVGRSK